MSGPKLDPRQFLVYVAGGVICAAIDVGLMWWMIAMGALPVAATTAGFLAGLAVNYIFHTRVTFDSPFTSASFARYIAVVIANYLLTIGATTLAPLALHHAYAPVLGKILALPLVALNGYWMSKHWVFK